jgi:superfamily II DNA or RNA helicase
MKITLRPYQTEVMEKVQKKLMNEKECVISASPSSGKTIMALWFIENTSGKFLILTHGQNVLKDMWEKEINLYLSEEKKKDVIYGLPQSITRKEIPKVDYIIVDEAHEFTYASMVQTILKANPKAKKIYLTGTPSKFIAKGYEPIVIPALELIKQDYISDLYVGVFSTKTKIKASDRNIERNLKEGSADKLAENVKTDMEDLLVKLIDRLKSSMFKGNPNAYKLTDWAWALGALHKTMFACSSIKQADEVVRFLEARNINVVSSNSTNDVNSENIKRFMEDPDIKVLVVVDRGILGFNMPDLVNVVDMTCSYNIDRIYQLYARVMRKNEKYKHKYFFKLIPNDEMVVGKFYMEAALCLMHEDFISRYNGKNLDGMRIPVMVVGGSRGDSKKESGKKKNKQSKTYKVDEKFFDTVTAAKVLIDLYNKADENLNEYAYVKFSQIREKVFGDFVTFDWKNATLKDIKNKLVEEYGDVRTQI